MAVFPKCSRCSSRPSPEPLRHGLGGAHGTRPSASLSAPCRRIPARGSEMVLQRIELSTSPATKGKVSPLSFHAGPASAAGGPRVLADPARRAGQSPVQSVRTCGKPGIPRPALAQERADDRRNAPRCKTPTGRSEKDRRPAEAFKRTSPTQAQSPKTGAARRTKPGRKPTTSRD